jgi:hypothetical protein
MINFLRPNKIIILSISSLNQIKTIQTMLIGKSRSERLTHDQIQEQGKQESAGSQAVVCPTTRHSG